MPQKKHLFSFLSLFLAGSSSLSSQLCDIGPRIRSIDKDSPIAVLRWNLTPEETLEMGREYLEGRDGPKDEVMAFGFILSAAEQGLPEAQLEVGRMLQRGTGTPIDAEKSAYWTIESAKNGNRIAQENAGNYYFYGYGIPKDISLAVAWFEKAADQGSLIALAWLGFAYQSGNEVPRDEVKSTSYYARAAQLGHVRSQCVYGERLLLAKGTSYDPASGIMWLKQAASHGWSKAQALLGKYYLTGCHGLPADEDQAYSFFAMAAENGDPEALYQRALRSFNTTRDILAALPLCLQAARAGNLDAQRQLSVWYQYEESIKNLQESFFWELQAALQGDAASQHCIGRKYEIGLGVDQDMQQAVTWYTRAAQQGFDIAIYSLARLYKDGKLGVPQDYQQALFWFQKGASLGDPDAQEEINKINALLASQNLS